MASETPDAANRRDGETLADYFDRTKRESAAQRYLCCNCGVITPPDEWTYWQREDDEDGLGQHWRDHARHAMESSLSLCQRATRTVTRASV